MISYHPLQNGGAHGYAHDFKVADTDDLERIGRGISRFVWSPIVWDGGHRRQDRFLRADLCVLDFDSPEMSLAEAVRVFCDSAHIIGTTRNHQREKHGVTCDRFRVVLRFARPITDVRSYVFSLQKVVSRYPADPAPKDGARFFYPCREIVSVATDGYTEAVREPPTPRERRAAIAIYASGGMIPGWMAHVLLYGVKVGGRSNKCYELGARFAELNFALDDALARVRASPLAAIGDERLTMSVMNGYARGLAEMEAPEDDRAQRQRQRRADQPGRQEEEKDPDQRDLRADRQHADRKCRG